MSACPVSLDVLSNPLKARALKDNTSSALHDLHLIESWSMSDWHGKRRARLVGIRDLNNPRVSRRRNRCPVALEPACDGHAMKRLLIFFVLVPIATPENGGRKVLQTAFYGATLWCGGMPAGMPAGCPPADARPNAMPEPNAPECAFPHAGLRRENQQLLLLLRGIEFMLCVGPRRTSKPCPDSTLRPRLFGNLGHGYYGPRSQSRSILRVAAENANSGRISGGDGSITGSANGRCLLGSIKCLRSRFNANFGGNADSDRCGGRLSPVSFSGD